jgi:hypothetical protein
VHRDVKRDRLFSTFLRGVTGLDDQAFAVHIGRSVRFVFGLLAIVCLAGCEKQSGEAIVVAKEHIAAAPPISETSRAGPAASPDEVSRSAEQPRSIGDDEITVDGHVMKPDVARHEPRSARVAGRTVARKSSDD